jgi:hypothetical protein
MSPSELAALAAELEPDIRAADNDMREIDGLQQKGITGAGTLSGVFTGCPYRVGAHGDELYICLVDYEALQPRLEALLVRHQEDVDRAAALEKRVAGIVRQYAIQVWVFFSTALLKFYT